MFRDGQWLLLGILHEPRKTLSKYIGNWSSLMIESARNFESDFIQAYQSLAYLQYLSIKVCHEYEEEGLSQFQICFREYGSCLWRLMESTKILSDSLYLALSGRYPSANALLRPAIECMTIGVFYTGLLEKGNRDVYRSKKDEKKFITLVETALEHPDCQTDSRVLELTVSNLLRNQQRSPPSYKKILEMIIEWNLLKLPENAENREGLKILYYDLYRPFSEVIHSRTDTTYFISEEFLSISGIELSPRFFHGERLIPDKLMSFLHYYNIVVDLVGYIFFSAIKRLFQHPKVSQIVLDHLDEFSSHAEELTLTKMIVSRFATEISSNT